MALAMHLKRLVLDLVLEQRAVLHARVQRVVCFALFDLRCFGKLCLETVTRLCLLLLIDLHLLKLARHLTNALVEAYGGTCIEAWNAAATTERVTHSG